VSPNRPIGYLAGQDTARRFSKTNFQLSRQIKISS
jgi:hypothetical protein